MAVITTLGVPDNSGNTTTIMPKLQYRFRVTFIGEGFSTTPTRSVVSISRPALTPVSYTHLRAHETPEHRGCRLLV